MKMLIRLSAVVAVALLSGHVAGAGPVGSDPTPVLDPYETMTLLYMREEEKLARDVYATLYESWGENVFLNISQAEQNHMDALLKQIEKYGLADPVVDDATGVFTDAALGALYLELVDTGDDSLLDGYLVGGLIEEKQIADLGSAIAETDEYSLLNAYSNLLAASRNHLRTFVAHVSALGVEYDAQILDPEDVDDIVDDYDVTPPQNFTMNAGLNDAWFFPGTNGQGFFLTVFPGQGKVFMGWFTYDTELPDELVTANLGDPGQRWLTAQGSFAGAQAELQIDSMSGGLFDSEEVLPVHEAAGSILLQFDDCASGSLYYDIPSIGKSGLIPIQRVCNEHVALCEQLSEAASP